MNAWGRYAAFPGSMYTTLLNFRELLLQEVRPSSMLVALILIHMCPASVGYPLYATGCVQHTHHMRGTGEEGGL
jgi:hypothetical protein